ncbi:MAG TPA: pyruvate-binding protein [Gammaproteobacteria bacterium]|nr:pyruvate-binding protein [Gammaproteobacteria bacterium]
MRQDVRHSLRSTSLRAGSFAAALCFAGGAHAAATVTGFEALLDGAGGTLDSFSFDNDANTIDIAKTFTSVAPLTIRITVGHGTGSGGPLTVSEEITNATGQAWTDYHYDIIEPDANNGVVFTAFQQSSLSGFSLDDAPDSGPRNLDFTGALELDGVANAAFTMSLPDPGAGNSYTFDLVQTPTVAPIPLPPAAWLFGSALSGMYLARRRR